MPRIRLRADAPEGGRGNVVSVSRTRAQDLVNGGQAERVTDDGSAENKAVSPKQRTTK